MWEVDEFIEIGLLDFDSRFFKDEILISGAKMFDDGCERCALVDHQFHVRYYRRVNYQVTILAAGMGTRLGKPFPKPLTPLVDGRTIMQQQIENIQGVFGESSRISIVVGFKMEMIMESFPRSIFIYNEEYDRTNTSKSLMRALASSFDGGVLWLNGDVVFDAKVLDRLKRFVDEDRSFVSVNTSAVGDEEVKYTVDSSGDIKELSKTVKGALGEAVGINFISSQDKASLLKHLIACDEGDYFERGLELAIEHDSLKVLPVDISDLFAVEVDFQEDLDRANRGLGA
jgi:choline kinase